MKNTTAIIQSRMGSSRLPGKVLMDIQGYPMIWHIIERVKLSKLIDDIIIATSDLPADNQLADYLQSIDVKFYRGSEKNVLERYFEAATLYKAKTIIRLTGDNPLVDPHILDETISFYNNSKFRYVSNIQHPNAKCTFPIGIVCEVFSYELLTETYQQAKKDYEIEHVTPYMYTRQDSFGCYPSSIDYSNYRFTVDTIQDYEHIKAIYKHFFKGKHDFFLDDIIQYLVKHPDISSTNQNVIQKHF